MKKNNRQVIVQPSPFKQERIHKCLPENLTIGEVANIVFSDTRGKALLKHDMILCYIGEQLVNKDYWHCIRAKEGHIVSFKVRLKGGGGGGGGKNIVSVIATIAIIGAAAYTGGLAFGAMGGMNAVAAGGATAAKAYAAMAIASAATMTVGHLLLNSLIPPAQPKLARLSAGERTSPTLSLTGARNQANPYGKSPVVYGKHRFHPPLAALPFTEIVGEDQYLRLLFDCGIGPLELTDFKIGTTDLFNYDGVEVEVREGYPDDAPLTLFSNSVLQDDYGGTALLYNTPITRDTRLETDEVIVDINFNGLVNFSTNGARQNRSVGVSFEYRKSGSSDEWQSFPAATDQVVEQKTALTKISAPAGQYYVDYRTDGKLGQNASVSFDLSCPTSLVSSSGTASVAAGISHRVQIKPVGTSTWQTVIRNFLVSPGTSRKVSFTARMEQQYDIRIRREYVSYYLPAPAPAANGGGYQVIQDPINIAYGTVTYVPITYTDKTEQLVRKSARVVFPEKAQWEIRITRTTEDTDDERIRDKSFLSNIKSIRYENPTNIENHAFIALRIKASGQLQGMLDTFNVLATRLLPIYDADTEAWIENQPTSNPAWIFCSIFCGNEAGQKKLSRDTIDLPSILEWAEACEQEPPHTHLPDSVTSDFQVDKYWEFNAVIDFPTTKFELARDVCVAGRARFATPSLKLGVVRDKEQTAPIQLFSPRNSRAFTGTRQFAKVPHALRARFVDESQDYQKQGEVVVYRDGYNISNSTLFDTLELFGCTSDAQAWREGRYHLAVMMHRPDSYTLETGIDNLRCTEGDLVAVVHDVPSWGLGFARIKSLVLNEAETHIIEIVLDDLINMEAGSTYVIQIRKQDGDISQYLPDTEVGENYSLYFDTNPIAITEDINIKDLIVFGTIEQKYVELVVKQIDYDLDMNASISFYDAAPQIHLADQEELPEYDPQRTPDPQLVGPQPAINLESTTSVRIIDGINVYDEIITYEPPGRSAISAYEIYQFTGDSWKFVTLTTDTSYSFNNINPLEAFKVAVVTIGVTGRKLSIDESAQLEKDIELVRPGNVTGFYLEAHDGRARAFWNTNNLRLSWNIRYHEELVDYYEASPIFNNAAGPGVDIPARVGYYYIKAVDFYGITSEEPAIVFNNTIGFSITNVVEEYEESPDWIGIKENVEIYDNSLILEEGETEGYYYYDMGGAGYLDLGQIYISRLISNLVVDILNRQLFDDMPGLFDSVVGLFDYGGLITDGITEVRAQVSYTKDDPAESDAEWSEWEDFSSADYEARAFMLRVKLTTTDENITPILRKGNIIIDMPDRIESGSGTSDPAGTLVEFDEFKLVKMILHGARGLESGDYWERTDETNKSFNIIFKDKNDIGVSRQFSYTIIGYGRVEQEEEE